MTKTKTTGYKALYLDMTYNGVQFEVGKTYKVGTDSDEDLIYRTFKDDSFYGVKEAVIYRLSDEDLIYRTFKDDWDWSVRLAVAEKLSDKDMLEYFVRDNEEYVKEATMQKLI